MAQVFLARLATIQASEWEKAKMTIENVEHFKEKLKETELYGKTDVLIFADKLWPDCSKPENWRKMDALCGRYFLQFDNSQERREDIDKSIAIFNAFAYPIIMRYANEIDSYESVSLEFKTYGNVIMPIAFEGYPKIGHHVKLLKSSRLFSILNFSQ